MQTSERAQLSLSLQNDKILPVRQLKKNRSTGKGLVKRKRDEVNELLSTSTPNISELKKKAHELETVMEKFRISHGNYHENLKDKEDIEESNEYFEAKQTRVYLLMERVTNVIEYQSSIVLPIITPHDSVSNAGESKLFDSKRSKVSCKSGLHISPSVKSTTSNSKARAAAEKAALEVEAVNYKKRMALQQEQEMLDLEIEIQKANAEEQAYVEMEKGEENCGS